MHLVLVFLAVLVCPLHAAARLTPALLFRGGLIKPATARYVRRIPIGYRVWTNVIIVFSQHLTDYFS